MPQLDPVLRDQRTMIGHEPLETIEDVEAAWTNWVVGYVDRSGNVIPPRGLPVRRLVGDTSTDLREDDRTLVAYVSGGKWIADCPNCNDGVAAWPEHDRGCCLGCGTIYHLDYPPADVVERVRGILEERPLNLRSWLVQNGETPEDLEAENERLRQMVQPDRRVVSVDRLREILSAREMAKLEQEGVV